MIQIARPFFRNKELILKDIETVLESGRLMNGEMTRSFEESFPRYHRIEICHISELLHDCPRDRPAVLWGK